MNIIDQQTLGQSDYTRKQMEDGTGWSIGSTDEEFLQRIKDYEEQGYVVEFKTNIFRRIFSLGIYKVIATLYERSK
jgi:hypothetical protein